MCTWSVCSNRASVSIADSDRRVTSSPSTLGIHRMSLHPQHPSIHIGSGITLSARTSFCLFSKPILSQFSLPSAPRNAGAFPETLRSTPTAEPPRQSASDIAHLPNLSARQHVICHKNSHRVPCDWWWYPISNILLVPGCHQAVIKTISTSNKEQGTDCAR